MDESIITGIQEKMLAAKVPVPAINAFLTSVQKVAEGATGLLSESVIDPVADLPLLDALPESTASGATLLNQLAVIKLNGGLGTGMGLDSAKSLIKVKGDDTFLDFIARQIFHLRQTVEPDLWPTGYTGHVSVGASLFRYVHRPGSGLSAQHQRRVHRSQRHGPDRVAAGVDVCSGRLCHVQSP